MAVLNLNGQKFVEHPPMGGYGATPNTIPRSTVFVVQCLSCARTVQLDREKTIDRMPYSHLWQIEKTLRCQCGEKTAKLMAGYLVTERGP